MQASGDRPGRGGRGRGRGRGRNSNYPVRSPSPSPRRQQLLSQHPHAGHRPRDSTEGPPGLLPAHSRKPYHPPATTASSSYRPSSNSIVLPRQPASAAHPTEFTTSTTAALPMLSNAPFAPPRSALAGGGGNTTRAPVGSLRRYNEDAALKQEVNQLLNQAHNTTPGTYVGKLSKNNNMLIPVLPRITK
ncbi:hypothetical protein H4R35_005478 [Dimargaris xerosporica]|nr:hypothetical protein H4R35_005478 [Dimargaris xerosporica]